MSGSRLTTMIFIGMLLGIAVGYACSITWPDPQTAKEIAGYIALVSDVFLRLIKMIIAPLVFSTLVVGIAHLGDTAAVGRVGGKALLWFVGASFCSLMLGLILVNIMQPGVNLNLPLPDVGAGTGLKTASLSLKEFVTHLVPKSAVEAMANNEILQIVVFSIFFGVGLAALGEKGHFLARGIEGLADVMLKVTGYVMMFAPVAVFAAIAATITTQGIGVLVTYGKFLVEFYIGLGVLWALLMGVGFLMLGGGGIMRLINLIKEPFVLAFSTASSEAAYPKMLTNLEKFGVPNRITSFVLPMGYSFNLDGSMMYCTFAVMFIAQAYNIPLTWGQQLTMLFLLMVTSKGMAGVPRASLVVISATLTQFNIPEAGLLLIIGIDQFLDMGRSATNVLGNSVATVAVAKWEGQLTTTDQRLDHVGTVVSPAE
ncbi:MULTISPECIES: dicarboxylate/amino acid:cation symporter [Methylobacterium]|uniref:Dicarboxylate/amino acid:cation symporter n=1 Tax=Methylobacterium longum TaxID=767694 RepID=A0ABT8AKF7_9HYPH|nr:MULTISPECIES: dicarboxylate/amino acid:cation symporter [Methylobacterium]MCJ2098494.1 dicarboxylate/amino acid:cation symporter [Methylobacterium sp. E-046]MDN3570300.1 dicarboxylate/amino acid:cation symporter [Methylobacterium longum]GJE11297.1 Proton/sodium-glutamate symport protein [Methylobacterium longum]